MVEEVGAAEPSRVDPAFREKDGKPVQSAPYADSVFPERRRSVFRWRRNASSRASLSISRSPGRGISTIRGSIVARSTIAHVFFPRTRPHDSPGFTTSAFPDPHRERPVRVAEENEVEPPPPGELPLQLVVGMREQDRPAAHRFDVRPLPERPAGRLLQPVAIGIAVAEDPAQGERRIGVPREDGRRADIPEMEHHPHPLGAKQEERACRGAPVVVGV